MDALEKAPPSPFQGPWRLWPLGSQTGGCLFRTLPPRSRGSVLGGALSSSEDVGSSLIQRGHLTSCIC